MNRLKYFAIDVNKPTTPLKQNTNKIEKKVAKPEIPEPWIGDLMFFGDDPVDSLSPPEGLPEKPPMEMERKKPEPGILKPPVPPRQVVVGKLIDYLSFESSKIPEFPQRPPPDRAIKDNFAKTVKKLQLEQHVTSKLSLCDILTVGPGTLQKITPKHIEDLPWFFIQNVMTLHVSARNTSLSQPSTSEEAGVVESSGNITSVPIHHLDVLCAVLHCSDRLLQQEIVSRMSMCHFPVPLLLPPGDDESTCTFMIWSMRDIVNRWQQQTLEDSKRFIEDSLANVPLQTFSFARLGRHKLSKSTIINNLLSVSQSSSDSFVDWEMECGSEPKTISNGLVELSWVLPGGTNHSNVFPEPFAITNLRGDLNCHWDQFTFLTKVSRTLFILVDAFTAENVRILTQWGGNATWHLIFSVKRRPVGDFLELLETRVLYGKLGKLHYQTYDYTGNMLALTKYIKECIIEDLKHRQSLTSLADMEMIANDLGLTTDKYWSDLTNAKESALSITKEIKNITKYKESTMKLQGALWQQISKIEKKMCRMKDQGAIRSLDYESKLKKEYTDLRKKQNLCTVPSGIQKFIHAVAQASSAEKCYFIKWMKFYLDDIARESLPILQFEFEEKCNSLNSTEEELQEIAQKISNSSLGVEHYLRELGQFYEAECSMFKEGKNHQRKRQFNKLPGIAADLLLSGCPLELIDGDVFNIQVQWITDVLNELDIKTGGMCRIRVITVLGALSSGKSTLLNTMFGLQFPVGSGRCTRGAFMNLIKVSKNHQQDLNCELIVVIDTEGLQAPELASLESSYEHDIELATLVVGLSDIIMVNISMKNKSGMKYTLLVMVHALLTINAAGRTPSCYILHQNASDMSTETNNMPNWSNLLKYLNELIELAADMEKKTTPILFSDIIDFHPEEHSWYIPDLFYGIPPMEAINSAYSDNIFSLKAKLFQSLKQKTSAGPQSLTSYAELVSGLWPAVKCQNFLFNFTKQTV